MEPFTIATIALFWLAGFVISSFIFPDPFVGVYLWRRVIWPVWIPYELIVYLCELIQEKKDKK